MFTALSIGGSLIQIFQYGAVDPSKGAIGLGKKLRVISGGLFIGLVSVTALFILVFAVFSQARYNRDQLAACDTSTSPKHPSWATVFVLALLTMLTLPEAIYRCVSSADTTGFIVTDSAVAVLVFLPEALIFVVFALVDFEDLSNVELFRRKRGRGAGRLGAPKDGAGAGSGV